MGELVFYTALSLTHLYKECDWYQKDSGRGKVKSRWSLRSSMERGERQPMRQIWINREENTLRKWGIYHASRHQILLCLCLLELSIVKCSKRTTPFRRCIFLFPYIVHNKITFFDLCGYYFDIRYHCFENRTKWKKMCHNFVAVFSMKILPSNLFTGYQH